MILYSLYSDDGFFKFLGKTRFGILGLIYTLVCFKPRTYHRCFKLTVWSV